MLVSARKLLPLPASEVTEAEYVHVKFDSHQIVEANGAPGESMFTGTQAMKSLTEAQLREIADILPDLQQEPFPVRAIPTGRKQSRLVERQAQHARALL